MEPRFHLSCDREDEIAVSLELERSGRAQREIGIFLPDSFAICNKEPALPQNGGIGSRVLNCELWAFYRGEEIAIPGKTFLFNAVIVAAYGFVHGTNGGSIRTVTGLYSLGQFNMAGKGEWTCLRVMCSQV